MEDLKMHVEPTTTTRKCRTRTHHHRGRYEHNWFRRLASWMLTGILVAPSMAIAQTRVIPVWPNGAPKVVGSTLKETMTTDPKTQRQFIHDVINPTLTAFLPPATTATGTGIVVVPGGGWG